ncbi:cytochrome P450 [Apodospora peruviana]|uniref:Cytochrome P450 n=1 Tax=Apodospora peruviana TaxID=516989 RepID=A0AAE0IB09_9PEZI|nr:cytochrome P450 [Apodospora peruviana]
MATTHALAQAVVDKLPLIFSTLGVLVAVILLQNVLQGNPLSSFPVIGAELDGDEKRRQAYMVKARDLYVDGYKKSSVLVVSPKFLDELKRLPDHVLSFDAAIHETMHAKYTLIETGNNTIPHTVKTGLTPALVRLNASISDEVQEAMRREIGECKDWTPVHINKKLLRIVGIVSGRVFIGPELCHSEEYLDAAINYTIELMDLRTAVEALPPWIRPFKANRLPEAKKLRQRVQQADAFLRPIIRARLSNQNAQDKPNDMLQWLIDDQIKFGLDCSTEKMARLQLGISFAAIHTTTMTTTNAFYNLAAHAELAPILRDEIRSVLAEHDGVFSSTALQAMKKLDSFLKETLRFHPPSAGSFQRKVLQPFTLSNGQEIPAGIIIEVPAQAIASDPDVYPDPEKFDALRFYKLREKAKDDGRIEVAAQGQFVSVSQSSLTFGYGRHACPGRFFAANEIKMIMANCLLKYDVKMVDGCTERYPNFEVAGLSIPDPTRNLLFKRIEE